MFNEKEVNILKLFLNGEHLHIDKIAKHLSMSTRTVSRAISDIKIKLQDYNMTLSLNNHLGYRLSYKTRSNLLALCKAIDISLKNKIELQIIAEILIQSPISIQSISEKLFYSESLISSKLKNVELLLKNYHLKYYSKTNYGIEIRGSEINIRRLIINEFMIFHNNRIIDTILPMFINDKFQVLDKIVKNKLFDYHLILSDMDYSNLLAVIIASSFRNSCSNNSFKYDEDNYNDFIKDLVIEINNIFHLEMGLNEISYISENTIFNKNISSELNSYKIKDFIFAAIKLIEEENPGYYQFSENFYNLLFIHIDLLIKRMNNPNVFNNPLLSKIKKDYFIEFNDAIKLGALINKHFNLTISDDEIGYLAIHLASSTKRKSGKKTAIIICNYGVGTSLIVKQKIEDNYPDIEILSVYPAAFLGVAINTNPDFIITTTKLDYYQSEIPVIEAGNILLNSNEKLNFNTDEFSFFFHPGLYFNTNINTREEMLCVIKKELTETLKIEQSILDSIIEREEISTTEIGNFFAMPHAIKNGDFKSFIAVFRNDKKIHWELGDVQLVFVLLLNQKDLNKVELLKKLYKKLENIKTADKLLSSSTYHELINTLNEGDEI